jgi:hypothetical protein
MYDTLSLVELKKLAKELKIKQYYIKKRAELLQILNMKELPIKFKLEKMTMQELRALAKERDMRGFWGLSKNKLLELLFPSHNEEEYNSQTSEHGYPQDKDSYEIGIEITEDTLEERLNNMKL